MKAKIIARDDDGNPLRVETYDGFAHCARPFDPETDGWMEDQLDPRDFPLIVAGRQMEELVAEVNWLRRENFNLKQSEKRWMSASGFGPSSKT